jgi:hypothetical protein
MSGFLIAGGDPLPMKITGTRLWILFDVYEKYKKKVRG